MPESNHFAAITKPNELAPLLKSIEVYGGSFVVRCALKLAPNRLIRRLQQIGYAVQVTPA